MNQIGHGGISGPGIGGVRGMHCLSGGGLRRNSEGGGEVKAAAKCARACYDNDDIICLPVGVIFRDLIRHSLLKLGA